MTAITQSEIDNIREAQADFLPDLVDIRRRISDGDQGYEPVFIARDVACRLSPGSGAWREVADKLQGIDPFVITFSFDEDVKPGDQIIDVDSRVYEVRAVKAPSSYQTAKQSLCDLVTDG